MLFPCPPATLMRACMEEARGVLLHSSLLRRLLRRVAPRRATAGFEVPVFESEILEEASRLRSEARGRRHSRRFRPLGPAALALQGVVRLTERCQAALARPLSRCRSTFQRHPMVQHTTRLQASPEVADGRLEAREKAPCPPVLYIAAPHANRQEFRSGTL